MGSAYGAVFLISTVGMGLGSWGGGVIHDHLGTYGWLFIGSAAIGASPMLVAFTFRAPRLMAQGATSSLHPRLTSAHNAPPFRRLAPTRPDPRPAPQSAPSCRTRRSP